MKTSLLLVVLLALASSAIVAGGDPIPVPTPPVKQTNMMGGYNWPDLGMTWMAGNTDQGAYANVWVDSVYSVTSVGSSFYTDWNDVTRFHWSTKIAVNLDGTPNVSDQMYSNDYVNRRGYLFQTNRSINYYLTGHDEDDMTPWENAYSSFNLSNAEITSANFGWDEFYADPDSYFNSYGVARLEVDGRLLGDNATQFGQMFAQSVPEPTTLILLGLGGIVTFVGRRLRRRM